MDTDSSAGIEPKKLTLYYLFLISGGTNAIWLLLPDFFPLNPVFPKAPYLGLVVCVVGMVSIYSISAVASAWIFVGYSYLTSAIALLFLGVSTVVPLVLIVSIIATVVMLTARQAFIFTVVSLCTLLLVMVASPQYEAIGLSRNTINETLSRENIGLAYGSLIFLYISSVYLLCQHLDTNFHVRLAARARELQQRYSGIQESLLQNTIIYKSLPRSVILLDNNDSVVTASYLFLEKSGLSSSAVEGRHISEVFLSPSGRRVTITESKTVHVSLRHRPSHELMTANIRVTYLLGRKLESLMDVTFPAMSRPSSFPATGDIILSGNVAEGAHLFELYLEREKIEETAPVVIRMTIKNYDSLLAKHGSDFVEDVVRFYIESLETHHFLAILRVSGDTLALLDKNNPRLLLENIGKELNNTYIQKDKNSLQLNFEFSKQRALIDFTNLQSFLSKKSMLTVEQREIRSRVIHQMRNDGFKFQFQAVHALSDTSKILFFEGLARWSGPEPLPPPVFIANANSIGVGSAMTKILFTKFCAGVQQLYDPTEDPILVSFNISAVDILDPDTLKNLKAQSEYFGIAPSRVIIEIIETHDVIFSKNFVESLESFTDCGFKIAIDDFGASFSSIERLVQIPFDYLKIDRYLTEKTGNPEIGKIMEAIVRIARELNVTLVAEGIETESQRQRLEYLGIPYGQGFLMSRPADPSLLVKQFKS